MRLLVTTIDITNGTYKDNTEEIKAVRKKKCRNHYIINSVLIASIFIPTCLLLWAFVLAPILS